MLHGTQKRNQDKVLGQLVFLREFLFLVFVHGTPSTGTTLLGKMSVVPSVSFNALSSRASGKQSAGPAALVWRAR